jgi:hypothetical protein
VSVTLLLFSAACTKEIKVDIPEHQPALVISSNTVVNDTVRVQVSRSSSILKYKYNMDLNVPDATVVLYENDKELSKMNYDQQTHIYSSGTVAMDGKIYSIKVSAPGFASVEARSDVASAVTINSVKRYSKVRLDMNGRDQDEIRISFNDPATIGDFYIVSITPPPFQEDTFKNGYHYSGCANTTDASVESIYNEGIDQNTCLSSDAIFFRDALFNGTSKELHLFISSEYLLPVVGRNGDTLYPSVELYHVPEAYFRYLKSYQFASENNGNPFAEPTNVYSNVKNGYGIFSIISADYKELK